MALLILLAGTARTGIVRIYLGLHTLNGTFLQGIVLVRTRHLGNLLSLHFLLDAYTEEQSYCLLFDVLRHIIEHFISTQLVFNQRIFLTVCLQTGSLTKLIHVINVIHPLSVNYFQKNYTLDLTDCFRLRELRFFTLVKFHRFLFQLLL